MGKPRNKSNRKKKGKLSKSSEAQTGKGSYSAEQLMEKVDDLLDSFQYELAQKFCKRALEMAPDDLRILETSGSLFLELDQIEEATQCFNRAVELSPDEGHSKYMYLGQLHTGIEAIQCFQKGIELMKKKLLEIQTQGAFAAGMEEEEAEVTNNDVSNAYCSVAEIFLTDACFEDDADVKCKQALDLAVECDNTNPEAYHLCASYWLSKDDKQNAKEMIEKGVSLWLPQLKEARDSPSAPVDSISAAVSVLGLGGMGQTLQPALCPLSYPARVNVAKTLIEVESYETASDILEYLLDEEDEVVEVWYLLGWINYLQGEDYKDNTRCYLQKAEKTAKKTKFDDMPMLQHITELLAEVGPGEEEEVDEDVEVVLPESDEEEGEEDMEH